MARIDLRATLGPLELRTPLVAASGTVGHVWEWAEIADVKAYGAAVAKSVSPEPWQGRPPPRVAPITAGMLNGIGIQNPGIDAWVSEVGPRIASLQVPVWGSAVAEQVTGYGLVAKKLEGAGVAAVEVNLSCPNLETGVMFSFDATASGAAVGDVVSSVSVPVGAKLSPNTPDLLEVAASCLDSGASFLTLTNTALGFGIDVETGRPLLSGGVGGYSGPGLKAIALRCVHEVSRALPDAPILGCGGVSTGRDVVEYLMAGASAVALGTIHLAEPRSGGRIARELERELERLNAPSVASLVGAATP